GVYNNSQSFTEETSNRKKSTRLIDCPFELYASRRRDNLNRYQWYFEVRNAEHNHDPSEDMSGHPIVRRLTEEQIESVAMMSTSGSRPREIISTLRQNAYDKPKKQDLIRKEISTSAILNPDDFIIDEETQARGRVRKWHYKPFG
ncbi:35742_t:CDS:2, partial [Racocetra persica]